MLRLTNQISRACNILCAQRVSPLHSACSRLLGPVSFHIPTVASPQDAEGHSQVAVKKYFVANSPQANYTDWATATCWRNLVATFVDRGVSRGERGGSPTVVNLSFLDWEAQTNKTTNSVALSPRTNYTDWATETFRRNIVPTFVDRGVSRGQRGGSPTVVNLSFLDRSRYFSFK
jgi:hypothetical protein